MKIFNICKEHRIHSFNLLIRYDQYQENSFPVMDKKKPDKFNYQAFFIVLSKYYFFFATAFFTAGFFTAVFLAGAFLGFSLKAFLS